MDGVLNFFKPEGITSHDCVNIMRRFYNTKKVGHTGTLDPMAVGVLPICIGKATKVSNYLLDVDKEYIATLKLGTSTDTQDSSGKAVNTSEKKVNLDKIMKTFKSFEGIQYQIPPMYSAKKVEGKKLYEFARNGIEIKRSPNQINIKELEILKVEDRCIIFRVLCSKGTYVRTLCNDIGETLGTYGHMSYLLRTKVGPFSINECTSLHNLNEKSLEVRNSYLLPMDYALEHISKVDVKDEQRKKLVNGLKVKLDKYYDTDKVYRVYTSSGFIGMGSTKVMDNVCYLKMDKVFFR